MSYRQVTCLSSIIVLSVGVWAGCSASGNTGSDIGNDVTPATPSDGVPLPPSHTGTDAETPDANAPVEAGKPPKKDGGTGTVDSGVKTPDPGDTCATNNEIFTRACGKCGTKQAACIAGVVTDYSTCEGETGECEPGRVESEACGNCGTHTKTCGQFCSWTTTACTGEPVDSCAAGTQAWSAAGCVTTGTVRSRACGAACTWSGLSACATADYAVTVAAGAGGVSNAIVPILTATRTKKVSGSCAGSPTLSATDDHAVSWIRVTNPGAQKATVTVWTSATPGGPGVLDTSLVAYAAKPTTDEELKACVAGAGESCNTALLPCGDASFGSLTGTNAIAIPAGETRVVGVVISAVPGQATSGPVLVSVRTDSLE